VVKITRAEIGAAEILSFQRARRGIFSAALTRRQGVPRSARLIQQSMVAAALRQAFLQPDRAQASAMLRHVADQLRPKWPKLAAFIDDSETDVLSP
jgi:hypothetical protein